MPMGCTNRAGLEVSHRRGSTQRHEILHLACSPANFVAGYDEELAAVDDASTTPETPYLCLEHSHTMRPDGLFEHPERRSYGQESTERNRRIHLPWGYDREELRP